MATLIDISKAVNADKEALKAFEEMPQQREKCPDFATHLCMLPYRTDRRTIDDGTSADAIYLHLPIPRQVLEGLYVRLDKSGAASSTEDLAFLRQKGRDGYLTKNCSGWEEMREAVVEYLALHGKRMT
jgi:hypothetical protein